MNAEAGVPVGDSTLLAKLREAATDHEDGFALMSHQFREVTDALPAVVTLIDAARTYRAVIEAEPHIGAPGYDEWEKDYLVTRDALDAALAPFVGEATQ